MHVLVVSRVLGWLIDHIRYNILRAGCKSSGFDRFAGVEGLRGLCHVKSIVIDRCVTIPSDSISIQYVLATAMVACKSYLVASVISVCAGRLFSLSIPAPIAYPSEAASHYAAVPLLVGSHSVQAISTNGGTNMPSALHDVGTGQGPGFGEAIVQIVYGYSLWQRICGVAAITKVSLQKSMRDTAEETKVEGADKLKTRQKRRAAASPSPA